MKILVLNSGSSSYKLAIYQFESLPHIFQNPLWSGHLDWGQDKNSAHLEASLSNGVFIEKKLSAVNHSENLKELLDTTWNGSTKCINALSDIDVVGHRIVHGGDIFHQPVLISADVKKSIAKLFPIAPLHNPRNLEGVEIIEKQIPGILQIAVFDTAFHNTLPPSASTYAGPYAWKELGIKRYGFHGISHKYCAERCAELLKCDLHTLKIISCHLGNGASLTAIEQGKSVDTTMGFTPLEGLMMGTRCGSIDPGILLFLEKEKRFSPKELDHTLNFESGLKGISGISGDMREIMRLSAEGNARAKLAYDMYVHSLKRNLGSMAAVLGDVNAVIFTAGIGENVPQIRQEACTALRQQGLVLDIEKNNRCRSDEVISAKRSDIYVLVIQTKEDWSIARTCWSFLQA